MQFHWYLEWRGTDRSGRSAAVVGRNPVDVGLETQRNRRGYLATPRDVGRLTDTTNLGARSTRSNGVDMAIVVGDYNYNGISAHFQRHCFVKAKLFFASSLLLHPYLPLYSTR
jgi:hypothetical protein